MIFLVMAGFYGYSLYRLMRKHQSIKHKVTRIILKIFRLPYLETSLD